MSNKFKNMGMSELSAIDSGIDLITLDDVQEFLNAVFELPEAKKNWRLIRGTTTVLSNEISEIPRAKDLEVIQVFNANCLIAEFWKGYDHLHRKFQRGGYKPYKSPVLNETTFYVYSNSYRTIAYHIIMEIKKEI